MSHDAKVRIQNHRAIDPYAGEHAIPGIRFRPAAAALGVQSWGMNVLELDPGCTGHPEHDHKSDGHEELYVVLSGAGTLRAGDDEHPLAIGDMAHVPGELRRKLIAGPEGLTVLALGGTPGQAYAPSMGG